MNKYALLKENFVLSVETLNDEEVIKKLQECYQVVQIEDIDAEPMPGWVLIGNRIVAPTELMTDEEKDKYQQNQQRLFGEKLSDKATDWFGARNLKLSREGSPVDVAALSSTLLNAKLLLQGGALKTARTVCSMVKGSFPAHVDIFDNIISEITTYLTNNGWN